ncbi:MAG: nucleotide exchange factor GrpE [Pirellulales bacterium]
MSANNKQHDGNHPGSREGVDKDQTAVDSALEQEGQSPEISSETPDLGVADASQDSAEDWEAQYAAQQDRVLRLHAEMENLRNRTARELADQRKYGSMPLLRDILPVIDNIDRAIESAQQEGQSAGSLPDEPSLEAPPNQDPNGLLEGFQLVRQQLLLILKQHHCLPIDALGKPFDPQLHEAILQQPSEDQPKDYVMMDTQTGYQLYDRVVQASKVIVSSGPVEG